jgi:hypothetical protein
VSIPGWLPYYFGRLVLRFGALEVPWRDALRFDGSAIIDLVDDEANDTVTVVIDGGGPGATGIKTINGDADHILTPLEMAASMIKHTGDLTADRTYTFDAPATDDDAYTRVVRSINNGSGNLIISTGVGNSISIPPGDLSLTLGFDTNGVFVCNTVAP